MTNGTTKLNAMKSCIALLCIPTDTIDKKNKSKTNETKPKDKSKDKKK